MIVLLILILLVLAGLVGYLVHQSSPPSPPPLDPEKVMQAAVDLHRIRRRLDVADLKHQQRRDALRLKRELAESAEDGED